MSIVSKPRPLLTLNASCSGQHFPSAVKICFCSQHFLFMDRLNRTSKLFDFYEYICIGDTWLRKVYQNIMLWCIMVNVVLTRTIIIFMNLLLGNIYCPRISYLIPSIWRFNDNNKTCLPVKFYKEIQLLSHTCVCKSSNETDDQHQVNYDYVTLTHVCKKWR